MKQEKKVLQSEDLKPSIEKAIVLGDVDILNFAKQIYEFIKIKCLSKHQDY